MRQAQLSSSIPGRNPGLRIFGKSPFGTYLRVNTWIWQHLPPPLVSLRAVRSYGLFLQNLVHRHAARRQYVGTFFLRNRPQLELMGRSADQKSPGSSLSVAVLGCSIGAEVYSILWTIRSTRPDLIVRLQALDISDDVLQFAAKGVYSRENSKLVGEQIFERLSAHEMREMFDWEGEQAKIKPSLKEGITWRTGDACSPELANTLGRQDMVVANNFLCHMVPADSERALRNIGLLVKPGGYLFVSGVDLNVRTKVALDLGWKPVTDLMEAIHDGDPSVRAGWPWAWWGLEPFDNRRADWKIRYAAVFQIQERP